MRIIVITDAEFRFYEPEAIVQLLDSGAAERVHLRKPGCTEATMRALIEAIPARLHSRLSLHDCQALAADYGCGVHLNSRYTTAIGSPVSVSCHRPEELIRHREADYCLLSPIFDSISKHGYSPRYSLDDLRGAVDERTIALGGITPAHFSAVRDAGFGGAAMLGYVWHDYSPARLQKIITEICSNS